MKNNLQLLVQNLGIYLAVNVFAPFVVKITKIDLEKANFVSIFIDASNLEIHETCPCSLFFVYNGSSKRNFVVFKYTWRDRRNHIVKVLNENALSDKIIRFSADYTNTNFGGMLRKGKNNVFLKLKQTLNRNILGMGCCAHIIRNSIQYASDCLPVDVDSIVATFLFFSHIYCPYRKFKRIL